MQRKISTEEDRARSRSRLPTVTTGPLRLRAEAPGQDAPKKIAEGMDARDHFQDGGGRRIRTRKVAAQHQASAPVRVVRPTKGGQEAPTGLGVLTTPKAQLPRMTPAEAIDPGPANHHQHQQNSQHKTTTSHLLMITRLVKGVMRLPVSFSHGTTLLRLTSLRSIGHTCPAPDERHRDARPPEMQRLATARPSRPGCLQRCDRC